MTKPSWSWIRAHGFGTAPDRIAERTEPGPHGCLLWPGAMGGGRRNGRPAPQSGVPQIRCSVEGRVWVESVTRIVWETEVGPVPNGMQVKRACANERCVAVEHLVLLSPNEMPAAAKAKAFANLLRGEASPLAKLTKRQVDTIRIAALKRQPLEPFAARYGVSRSTIYHIAGGYLWKRGASRRDARKRTKPGEAPYTQHCGHCHKVGHRRNKCPELATG